MFLPSLITSGENIQGLDNLSDGGQINLITNACTSFLKSRFSINNPTDIPHIVSSNKIKNFSAIPKLKTIRIPMDKALQNLEALEFTLLHEYGHLCYPNTETHESEEFWADRFATRYATNTKTIDAVFKSMDQENRRKYGLNILRQLHECPAKPPLESSNSLISYIKQEAKLQRTDAAEKSHRWEKPA